MTDIANTFQSRHLRDTTSGAVDSDRNMALKLFSGTVLEAYRSSTVFVDGPGTVVAKKTLNGGHIAQWPVIGEDMNLDNLAEGADDSRATWTSDGDATYDHDAAGAIGGLKLGYHTPGDFISGMKVKMAEKTVRVDDTIVAAIDVPMQDLDISHFEILRPFATKLGRALSFSQDKKIAIIAANAAMGTGSGAGVAGVHGGGHSVIREGNAAGDISTGVANLTEIYSDDLTGAQYFTKDCADLARKLDEANVPEEDRFLFIPPIMRRVLRWDTTIFDRDFNTPDVANTINNRAIGMIEGFKVVMTNHLPDGDSEDKYHAIDANLGKYDYKFDGTGVAAPKIAAVAMCGAREGAAGVGMVQAGGTRTVIEDDNRRGLKFMRASQMVGFDVIAPWCCGLIGVADNADD